MNAELELKPYRRSRCKLRVERRYLIFTGTLLRLPFKEVLSLHLLILTNLYSAIRTFMTHFSDSLFNVQCSLLIVSASRIHSMGLSL